MFSPNVQILIPCIKGWTDSRRVPIKRNLWRVNHAKTNFNLFPFVINSLAIEKLIKHSKVLRRSKSSLHDFQPARGSFDKKSLRALMLVACSSRNPTKYASNTSGRKQMWVDTCWARKLYFLRIVREIGFSNTFELPFSPFPSPPKSSNIYIIINSNSRH